MDSKITLSFNASIIEKAKTYAASQGLSLSRLTEILLRKAIDSGKKNSLESIPIEDWVNAVAEGEVEYKSKHPYSKKEKIFFESRK